MSTTSERGSIRSRARCSASSPDRRAKRSCACTSAPAIRPRKSSKSPTRCDVSRIRSVLAISLALAFVVGGAGVATAKGKADSAAVRAATEKYHDLNAAIADGYVQFYKCTEQPGVGTMGQHYV